MSEDTKQRILEVGADLVHRQGFNNTGLKDILKAAGVPKGSFYFYFDSKETFGIELAHYLRKRSREAMLPIINDETKTPLERLHAMFSRFQAYFASHGYTRGCPIGNLAQEMSDLSDPFRIALNDALDGMIEGFAYLLREAQKVGEIPADLDTDEAALFIVQACQGAFIRVKLLKNAEPLDTCRKYIFEKLLK